VWDGKITSNSSYVLFAEAGNAADIAFAVRQSLIDFTTRRYKTNIFTFEIKTYRGGLLLGPGSSVAKV
jgi:hypothetical protein